MNLASTIEAWNYANIELDSIDSDLEKNARHLVAAKKSLVVAHGRIATRLRELYVSGSGDSTLEVLLGASSLDDIVSRLNAIERVSSQDARVLREVKQFKREVEDSRDRLQKARADQARIVAEQAAQKAEIESRLAERQQMLSSVKDEIVQLQAEERRRAAEAAAQARARLQAQQAAAAAASAGGLHGPLQRAGVHGYPDRRAASRWKPGVAGRRDRDAVPRHPVRLGRGQPVGGFRLLRPRQLRLRADRRSICRTTRRRRTGTASRSRTASSRPETSSSSAASGTWACTSAAASSSTRRTRATS